MRSAITRDVVVIKKLMTGGQKRLHTQNEATYYYYRKVAVNGEV